jgi:hypothetical protein
VTPVHDQDTVAALVERIVSGAHIPSRSRREDLRRELLAHFEDAGTSPDAVREALRRFGVEQAITDSLRSVYRWDYVFLYLAKITASIVASMAVALVIQVLVNLRVEVRNEVWRLAPGFSRATALSVAVVLGLVTVWEVGRQPFNRLRTAVGVAAYAAICAVGHLLFADSLSGLITATLLVAIGCVCSKLPFRPARLPLTLVAFAAALYAVHFTIRIAFGPMRALMAGAVLVVVWTATVLILTRLEHGFDRLFETPKNGAA